MERWCGPQQSLEGGKSAHPKANPCKRGAAEQKRDPHRGAMKKSNETMLGWNDRPQPGCKPKALSRMLGHPIAKGMTEGGL